MTDLVAKSTNDDYFDQTPRTLENVHEIPVITAADLKYPEDDEDDGNETDPEIRDYIAGKMRSSWQDKDISDEATAAPAPKPLESNNESFTLEAAASFRPNDEGSEFSLSTIPVLPREKVPSGTYILAGCTPSRSTSPDSVENIPTTIADSARPHKKRKIAGGLSSAEAEDLIPAPKLTPAQREHKALHEKAKSVMNVRHKGPRKYWVGIVVPGVKTSNIKKDADLVWMSARPKTTLRTVREQYKSQAAGSDGVCLQINGEIPAFSDRMQELDFFNDQHIIFRPVSYQVIDE